MVGRDESFGAHVSLCIVGSREQRNANGFYFMFRFFLNVCKIAIKLNGGFQTNVKRKCDAENLFFG